MKTTLSKCQTEYETKTCSRCKEIKPVSAFCKHRSVCKPCSNSRDIQAKRNWITKARHNEGKWFLYQMRCKWRQMIGRCYNPKHHNYRLYGSRGITVCERWKESFELFVKDMGSKPDGWYIDRIDGKGNYEPSNCRWVSPQQSALNLSSNRRISYNGKTLCLSEWSRELNIPQATIRYRLNMGWKPSRILTP